MATPPVMSPGWTRSRQRAAAVSLVPPLDTPTTVAGAPPGSHASMAVSQLDPAQGSHCAVTQAQAPPIGSLPLPFPSRPRPRDSQGSPPCRARQYQEASGAAGLWVHGVGAPCGGLWVMPEIGGTGARGSRQVWESPASSMGWGESMATCLPYSTPEAWHPIVEMGSKPTGLGLAQHHGPCCSQGPISPRAALPPVQGYPDES